MDVQNPCHHANRLLTNQTTPGYTQHPGHIDARRWNPTARNDT